MIKKRKRGNPYKRVLHLDGRIFGKYKNYPDRQISRQDFLKALKGKQLSSGHKPRFVKPSRDKAYLTVLFFMGPRKLEPTVMSKENVVLTKKYLVMLMPVFKGGERAGPIKLKRDKPGVEYVIKQWQRTKKGKQIFRFSASTAYRIVTRALGVCPHWLRHNFITIVQRNMPGNPTAVDEKIMSFTGHKSRSSLDHYRIKSDQDITEIAEVEI